MTSLEVVTPKRIGDYDIRGVIGEGSFSIVKLAYDNIQQRYFACKIVPKHRLMALNLVNRFESEIRINQQLHHPGVVALVDVLKDDVNFYVIMEFCPNGELFQFIVDKGRLQEDEAKHKIKQILETIKYIHSLGITHRDLKPENILLDQYGQMKISDFGLSRFVDSNGLANTPCGSPCYASPECISGKPYNGKTTDIWSCGVILYAMVTGQLPWTKRNQAQLFSQIRKGEYSVPHYVSPECSDLIQQLMTVDFSRRITVDQALSHRWLDSISTYMPYKGVQYGLISMKHIDLFFEADEDANEEIEMNIEKSESMGFGSFESSLKLLSQNNIQIRKGVSQKIKKKPMRKSIKYVSSHCLIHKN